MPSVDCVTEAPNGYRHTLTIGAHTLHADLAVASGGGDTAPGAHEYFDASLAACKALTAMWFAKTHGIALETIDVHVERDDREEKAGKYKLLVKLAFHGALSQHDRERLYAAVAKCPVSKLMTTTEVLIETAPLEAT